MTGKWEIEGDYSGRGTWANNKKTKTCRHVYREFRGNPMPPVACLREALPRKTTCHLHTPVVGDAEDGTRVKRGKPLSQEVRATMLAIYGPSWGRMSPVALQQAVDTIRAAPVATYKRRSGK